MSETSPDEPMTGEGDQAIAADSDATSAGTGSGRGGDLGTPSKDMPAEEPPSEPQERNAALSGGGKVNTTRDDEPGPILPGRDDDDQAGSRSTNS
jgi:hypothetical protein